MDIRCPYCNSSNVRKLYAEQLKGSLLDVGVALLKSYVTGSPYHSPTTHFGDAAAMREKQCKCKNCGRVFDEDYAKRNNDVSTIKMDEKQTLIFEKIRTVVANILGVRPNEVTMNADFYEDLGACSLDMLEICIELEKEFHISVDDDEALNNIKCVEDAVLYVYSKL